MCFTSRVAFPFFGGGSEDKTNFAIAWMLWAILRPDFAPKDLTVQELIW